MKASIIITTYNQQDYIEQAIESAMMQECDYPYEIIISDDGSQDRTPEIVAQYTQQHPTLIRNISQQNNVGISENMRRCFMSAQGEYLAILEGDDYWDSPHKLQKQIEFLEHNKDCSMVFSRVRILREGELHTAAHQDNLAEKLCGRDFLNRVQSLMTNFSTCMYRTKLMQTLPEILFKERFSEIPLSFHLDKHGKIGFMRDFLSVYRVHDKGVWSGASELAQLESALAVRVIARKVAKKQYFFRLTRIILRLKSKIRRLKPSPFRFLFEKRKEADMRTIFLFSIKLCSYRSKKGKSGTGMTERS